MFTLSIEMNLTQDPLKFGVNLQVPAEESRKYDNMFLVDQYLQKCTYRCPSCTVVTTKCSVFIGAARAEINSARDESVVRSPNAYRYEISLGRTTLL